jgi:hypothetical protein
VEADGFDWGSQVELPRNDCSKLGATQERLERLEQGRLEQGRLEQGRLEQGRLGRLEQGRLVIR